MFGLFTSREDLDIVPEKYQYAPGETVKGTITLKLKKPLQAKALTVSIRGEKFVTTYNTRPAFTTGMNQNPPGMQNNRSTASQTLFSFDMPLDGAKEYSDASYPFEIKLPDTIDTGAPAAAPGGMLGAATSVLSAMEGQQSSSQITWNLYAQLDIPGAIDMRKKIQINVA